MLLLFYNDNTIKVSLTQIFLKKLKKVVDNEKIKVYT
nr:MAG TPA: hypothetical protein [Caudoviricetes sp.]DAN29778.1 MAG TPA: hypothetical protein [Caudoviricetes sp.]DAT95985.1 MAG TPA: hypothetical protein [Caudoviricetes sp.]